MEIEQTRELRRGVVIVVLLYDSVMDCNTAFNPSSIVGLGAPLLEGG